MLKEFREFALRGNVVDMALGIMIGAAFGAIAASLVSDVLMPPIGLLLGNVDFADLFVVLKAGTEPAPYTTLADAQAAGAVTLNYGLFVNRVISFLIVAWAAFMVVRVLQTWKARQEAAPAKPTTKSCPYCVSTIPIQATRCPACTSTL